MAEVSFQGFAGLELKAEVLGHDDDPAVLLLHSGCEDRTVWNSTAEALVAAGRRVINLNLRGHGQSGRPEDKRYDFESFVEDLRAILSQIDSRPVIIAGPISGWFATVALTEMAVPAASGLILVDSPPRLDPQAGDRRRDELREAARACEDLRWDPAFLDGFDHRQAIGRIDDAAVRLSVPTLFIRSVGSAFTSKSDLSEFIRLIRDVESAEIDGADDLLAADTADTFNAVVLDFLERKCPRHPQSFESGSDTRLLWDAIGCFATGVCVVTAMANSGIPIGLTVNSFTSVSLDPPLVLVCIARSAGSLPQLEEASHFAINILHIGQQPTSNLFARPGEDRFAKADWELTDAQIPILTNSIGNIECSRYRRP